MDKFGKSKIKNKKLRHMIAVKQTGIKSLHFKEKASIKFKTFK